MNEIRDAIVIFEADVDGIKHRVSISPYIERNKWTVTYACGPFFLVENSYENESEASIRARALATYLSNHVLKMTSG